VTAQPSAAHPPIDRPDPLVVLADLFAGAGAADYLGEAVTVAVHMRQAGALAEDEGARGPIVAAALLHDVGHLRGEDGGEGHSGTTLMAGTDTHHGDSGASWLAQWFGPEVTELVRLHVEAKRYLCTVEPGYTDSLSPASLYTLGLQGGPMDDDEVAAFTEGGWADDAVRVRRYDDLAKDPDRPTPEFSHFEPLLRTLLRT
jgi:gamma-butyrobetaine dioxygenase